MEAGLLDSARFRSAGGLALLTDQYELSMAEAYLARGMHALPATFSLFVRQLPQGRNYLLAAGLEDVLSYLEALSFVKEDLDYLRELGFADALLEHLAAFRFEGDVRAMPEGTPLFAEEPILEVDAPLLQAQLIETYVMNQVHMQTVFASKAARVCGAAGDKPVVDFGLRRAHGSDAGLKASRAFYIAGISATSNLLAGRRYGIPVTGTMAHSYVQAYDEERTAFHDFARAFPDCVLLVDTYDSLAGVQNVVALAREPSLTLRVRGIRLDSGDLDALSRSARRILDEAGLARVKIFASGGLDEQRIAALLARGAPIDGFGVGSAMSVSADAPQLDIVYKLTALSGKGRVKLSAGKRTRPGPKQVFRLIEGEQAQGDVLARAGERLPGQPLLEPAMVGGVRTEGGRESLAAMRQRAERAIAQLPARVHALRPADPPYEVVLSRALRQHEANIDAQFEGTKL